MIDIALFYFPVKLAFFFPSIFVSILDEDELDINICVDLFGLQGLGFMILSNLL